MTTFFVHVKHFNTTMLPNNRKICQTERRFSLYDSQDLIVLEFLSKEYAYKLGIVHSSVYF